MDGKGRGVNFLCIQGEGREGTGAQLVMNLSEGLGLRWKVAGGERVRLGTGEEVG